MEIVIVFLLYCDVHPSETAEGTWIRPLGIDWIVVVGYWI